MAERNTDDNDWSIVGKKRSRKQETTEIQGGQMNTRSVGRVPNFSLGSSKRQRKAPVTRSNNTEPLRQFKYHAPPNQPIPVPKDKFINYELDNMSKLLYDNVCLQSEEFQQKMGKKDPEYIKLLSERIDAFTNKLVCDATSGRFSSWLIDFAFQCKQLKDTHCHTGNKCQVLPGWYKDKKAFLPHLYHILQDYGFFWDYIGFNNIDIKNDLFSLGSEWQEKLTEKQEGMTVQEKKTHLSKLMVRVKRVKFLREFDVKCCLQKGQDSNHELFDNVLKGVEIQLSKKLDKLDPSVNIR